MRSSSPAKGPRLLAIAIALASCHRSDASVGCSPTLTCSLRDARFDPKDEPDAGPVRCASSREGCRAKQIATGGMHSCAITEAGEVLCWGNSARGQLGVDVLADAGASDTAPDQETENDPDAGLVPLMGPARQVTAGGDHSCVIAESGKLYCWGDNRAGQIDGHPSLDSVLDPVAIPIEEATEIAAGAQHTCAIVAATVQCWGSSRFGQAGRQVSDEPLEIGEVPGTEGAVEIAAGVRHSCARMKSGHVRCWGERIDAETGAARSSAEPFELPSLDDATAIAAGAGQTCALRSRGSVVCWGENSSGQLGDGSTRSSAVPVMVKGLELSLRVSTGGIDDGGALVGHSCVLTKSFAVQCWGRNREGQLGRGNEGDGTTAEEVLAPSADEDENQGVYLNEALAISAGGLHTCAIDDHGRPIYCWGDNTRDQLDPASDEQVQFGRPTQVKRFRRMR